jgi:hypothetical protein
VGGREWGCGVWWGGGVRGMRVCVLGW